MSHWGGSKSYIGLSLLGVFRIDGTDGSNPQGFTSYSDLKSGTTEKNFDCGEAASEIKAVLGISIALLCIIIIAVSVTFFMKNTITLMVAKVSLVFFLLIGVVLPAVALVIWQNDCRDVVEKNLKTSSDFNFFTITLYVST